MPRKKNGMEVELQPRPTKGEDGRPLLYARPASDTKYDIRALDEFCHKNRGMHSGELVRSIETFSEVAAYFMGDGARVQTPFGSFAVKVRLDGDYTDPKQVKPKNIHFAGIEFIPSKEFLNQVSSHLELGFRRVGEPSSTELLRDPEAMEEVLRKALKNGYTTVRYFCGHSGLKYTTARRYLNSLCEGENPRLRKRKEGPTVHYMPIKKDKR